MPACCVGALPPASAAEVPSAAVSASAEVKMRNFDIDVSCLILPRRGAWLIYCQDYSSRSKASAKVNSKHVSRCRIEEIGARILRVLQASRYRLSAALGNQADPR